MLEMSIRTVNYQYKLSIQRSQVVYRCIFRKSSGTTNGFERYDFPDTTARYVKITVNGNTLNDWASVSEVRIFGDPKNASPNPPPNPPPTPPPSDSTVNIAAAGGPYKAQGTKYLCSESVLVWRVAVCEPNLTQFLDFLLERYSNKDLSIGQ